MFLRQKLVSDSPAKWALWCEAFPKISGRDIPKSQVVSSEERRLSYFVLLFSSCHLSIEFPVEIRDWWTSCHPCSRRIKGGPVGTNENGPHEIVALQWSLLMLFPSHHHIPSARSCQRTAVDESVTDPDDRVLDVCQLHGRGNGSCSPCLCADCTACCGEQPARRPAYAKAGLNRDRKDKGFSWRDHVVKDVQE